VTRKFILLGVCLSLAALSATAHAQSSINPDISLIGDIRSSWNNNDLDPESDRVNLNLHEAELALQGYLNPYARADAFVAFHEGEGAELEELYITFTRGLPLGLSVKAGQYLLDFGKTNPLHPHAYSFIVQPLPNAEYFGGEGLRDVGVHASIPLPTGNVETTISIDVLKGDFIAPHVHGDEESHEEEIAGDEQPNERGFAGRWNSFVPLGDYTSLALGGSAVTGVPEESTRRWIWGADAKFRWKPDRYRSLTLIGEYTGNRQPLEHEHDEVLAAAVNHEEGYEYLTSHGLFGYVDYQFRQRYNIGAMGDWVQGAKDKAEKLWRLGGFVGFAPVEETSLLKALVTYNKDVATDEGYWSGIFQLVFSLGPHKPHAF
jgi:hypothetical protein